MRNRILLSAAALTGAAALALAAVQGVGASRASAAAPGQTACPEGGIKVDEAGPAAFECREGRVVTGICVKAGTKGYGVGAGETANGPGCYAYEGVGAPIGAVLGGGTGRSCKEISFSVFYCGEPPAEPVCGNEVVEEGEQCDPPGRIDELLVCSESCQLLEVPEPGPEPVCGNEVVEPGESCDPPGRIDEVHVCDATCQLIEEPIDPEPPLLD
jgi:hypothetical protein